MKKTYLLIVMKVNKQTLLGSIHKRNEEIENNQKLNKDIVLGMNQNKIYGSNFLKSNELHL